MAGARPQGIRFDPLITRDSRALLATVPVGTVIYVLRANWAHVADVAPRVPPFVASAFGDQVLHFRDMNSPGENSPRPR